MSWVQDQLDDETLFPSKIGEYRRLSDVMTSTRKAKPFLFLQDVSINGGIPQTT
jgi:hypothetical protein